MQLKQNNEQMIAKKDQEEIKEIVSLFVSLSPNDRAILLASANAFKVRNELEKTKN